MLKIRVDTEDVPGPWCSNWKEILKDEKILPLETKIGVGKKTLLAGRLPKSVMNDGLSNMALNKREQKSQLKDVADINAEIQQEESGQTIEDAGSNKKTILDLRQPKSVMTDQSHC